MATIVTIAVPGASEYPSIRIEDNIDAADLATILSKNGISVNLRGAN